MSRSFGSRRLASLPYKNNLPRDGDSKPAIIHKTEDFPHPDGPHTVSRRPGLASNIYEKLSTAMVLPYFFVTFLNSSFIFLRLSRAAALCGAVNELTECKLYKQAEYYYHQRPCKKIDCLKIYL